MFAGNMFYLHEAEFFYLLFDQSQIFGQIVVFSLVFSPYLKSYKLGVYADNDFLGTQILGEAQAGEKSFTLCLIIRSWKG